MECNTSGTTARLNLVKEPIRYNKEVKVCKYSFTISDVYFVWMHQISL